MGKISNMINESGNRLGTAIGEGYAKQGKSWDEVVNMPSSGSGMMSDAIRSGTKTGYDNYMTNNKPASVSTSSANMIQSPGGSDGGLAASAVNANAVGTGVIGAKSKFGRSMERQLNRLADNGVIRFNQTQSQGDILGTQGIKPYDSQSNAQSMNANPMLNNGLGSLGQNNTNDVGISGFGNMSTTQKYNGLGNIIGNNPQGNNYNIIGGVELV